MEDPQPWDQGEIPVVRDVHRTVSREPGHKLERIGCLDTDGRTKLRRRAQEGAIQFDQAEVPAAG